MQQVAPLLSSLHQVTLQGIAASRNIAIGRACVQRHHLGEVSRYRLAVGDVAQEIQRLNIARHAVAEELQHLQKNISIDVPHEIAAILDVHLMILTDDDLIQDIQRWIEQEHYNAEWALVTQLDLLMGQFEGMNDPYLRERKFDLEQVVERILTHLQDGAQGHESDGGVIGGDEAAKTRSDVEIMILVAHDLSPADMLKFRTAHWAGFVTDAGSVNAHSAIVARSLDIPAVVGVRTATQHIKAEDMLIVDGDRGIVIVNPDGQTLAAYRTQQNINLKVQQDLERLRFTPARTLDGEAIALLANIDGPEDAKAAVKAGTVGVGLFRSEFLYMGRSGVLPSEQEQFQAYTQVLQVMQGLPVTVRTVDVGADKPLDSNQLDARLTHGSLGLRAIRWCLSDLAMFRTQLRALLRAAAFGKLRIMLPMLSCVEEAQMAIAQIEEAQRELNLAGQISGSVEIGAMIEVPAAALQVEAFLTIMDFISIGTNDLIQYTLAVDRGDAKVAHLYNPRHPAVLQLIAHVIKATIRVGKPVSVCGEMAGDVEMTQLLLGLGLRQFSMYPSQVLRVKREILCSNTRELAQLHGTSLPQ